MHKRVVFNFWKFKSRKCSTISFSRDYTSQGQKNKKGAVSNANFGAFEAALFLCFLKSERTKRKKPRFEAKKSMTKRGSVKSSFLRVIQFRGELV